MDFVACPETIDAYVRRNVYGMLTTGSIACSAKPWYISYSESDFEVFRPEGATRCTDGGKISLHRCNDKGIGLPKLNFLLKFYQNSEYKSPTGAHFSFRFPRNLQVCTSFQDALAVKISLDLLKGLWSYEGYVDGVWLSPNFQCPAP